MSAPTNLSPAAQLRALRIIVAAMAGGVFAFLLVAIVLVEGKTMTTNPALAGTLLPVLALFAFAEAAGYVVLRAVLNKKFRSDVPAESATSAAPTSLGIRATITIIGCAMADGLGLFGAVVYLLTGNRLALVVPVAAIFLIALQWPGQRYAQ